MAFRKNIFRKLNKAVKCIVILIFLTSIFAQSVDAKEHKLEDLDINVFIASDGNAKIREKRKVDLSKGTENFLIIGNLGKSTIKDFQVKENGRTYQYTKDWNIKASREEKSFKNSIIEKKNGYELVWGIGDYGDHEYIIEYTITDFIKELQDAQIVFWKFVNDNTNLPPEKLRVTIESESFISYDNEKVWAFGFDGNVNFKDGKVVAENTKALNKDQYVTLLVKFPQGSFYGGEYIDKSFETIKNQAFKGSDYGDNSKIGGGSFKSFMSNFTKVFFPLVLLISVIINLTKGLIKASDAPRNFRRRKKEQYYREYPYKGNFLDIYYIPYKMGASNFENLITSFILKWIKNGKIEIQRKTIEASTAKKQSNIKFLDKNMDSSTFEGELFFMLLDEAKADDILEEKEFAKWARKNKRKLNKWEKKIRDSSIEKLKEAGYIKVEKKKKTLFTKEELVLTKEGKELENNLYKYINYIYDFSLLNEREAVDVNLWDNIMVWASALGLANIVRTQFRKLYPKYEDETAYSGSSVHFTTKLTRSINTIVSPSSGRTGGAGGFSSSGGGGGSFGGGSGGGTR